MTTKPFPLARALLRMLISLLGLATVTLALVPGTAIRLLYEFNGLLRTAVEALED